MPVILVDASSSQLAAAGRAGLWNYVFLAFQVVVRSHCAQRTGTSPVFFTISWPSPDRIHATSCWVLAEGCRLVTA